MIKTENLCKTYGKGESAVAALKNASLEIEDGVRDMRQYLFDLKAQGKTILIASHSAEDIDVLCDTVCEMDKGVVTVVR